MSNSIGNNLLHQSFLPSTLLETQKSRINSSSIGGNTLISPQATSTARRSPLSTEFLGCKLTVQRKKSPMGNVGKNRSVSGVPRAVLTTDSSSGVTFEYMSVLLLSLFFIQLCREEIHCLLPLFFS